jgi:Uma2 family endonuclease
MGALPQTAMTVEAFLDWSDRQPGDERYELVDGEVVAMGRDRVSHNRAKLRSVTAIARALTDAGVDCEAFVDGIGVTRNDHNFRFPDVVVNCGPVDSQASFLPSPIIIVEVVSPTSEDRDVHIKLAEYFEVSSVMHYLILYPERRLLIHHARMGSSNRVEAEFVTEGEIALSPPGITIHTNALFGDR